MQTQEVNELEGVERAIAFRDDACGLRGFVVLDDVTLGPAAGGVRTWRYADDTDALVDAARLARAMTYKCSLGGVDAGGGKCVVIEHEGLDRPRAFAALGELVESLDGLFRTAGDLGTRVADLEAMATTTQYVHRDEPTLTAAVARGVLRCMEACAERGEREMAGLQVAVQGCGAIGTAVARALAGAGAALFLADVEPGRVVPLAAALGADVVAPDESLAADVDVLAPCAVGGVLDDAAVDALRAWAVCGAANNILADDAIARRLADAEVLLVPDLVASAGAVIDGIGRTVMDLEDPAPLIDYLGQTTRAVLDDAERSGRTTVEAAIAMARFRIGARRFQDGSR